MQLRQSHVHFWLAEDFELALWLLAATSECSVDEVIQRVPPRLCSFMWELFKTKPKANDRILAGGWTNGSDMLWLLLFQGPKLGFQHL